ncbi:MAG TPA: endonuclease III [Acidimicrobiia bacterium]
MKRLLANGDAPTPAERGKARAVINRLLKRYPMIKTALEYESAWQLLVVTAISAQTTDENVNKVAPVLFRAYPDAESLADANPEDVEKIIYSTGFYRQKTKSIITLSRSLVDLYGGVVPADLDELTRLHGVGRKTASVVLAEVWDFPAIAVDTHVNRVSRRLGLTTQSKPEKIERDLMALYPVGLWSGLSMRFIQFGRDTCDARQPLCGECELFSLCEWPDRFEIAARK